MLKKIIIALIISSICIVGAIQLNKDENSYCKNKAEQTIINNEEKILSAISANTFGTDFDKQMAIINCLYTVWADKNLTIEKYFKINYPSANLNNITENDSLIVQIVIDGIVKIEEGINEAN